MKSVVIPDGVKSIGLGAFRGCYALEFVSLPSSLNSNLYSTFYECNNLTIVEANMTTPVLADQYTFPNRTNATLYVPNGTKTAYEAADVWKDFANISEVGYIGNVDSELTGETSIACFVVNRPGKLNDLFIQAGKPKKVKIIGEIDSNDLSALSHDGYSYEMYYPTYVDLSEAHINASSHYNYDYPYGYQDYPDNYLDSDWMLCRSSESDDGDWYGPETIVLPMTLQEYVGRAYHIYSEQTTPFKTTIKSSMDGYLGGTCKFHVPTGTRMSWIEKTTYPDNVQFIDGPSKVINVITAGELASLLTYDEIESMNELTITGHINAKDFSVIKQMSNLVKLTINATIEAYSGNEGPVAGQTEYQAGEVPAYSFKNNTNLQSVSLPRNTIIGDYAFDGCTSLKTLSCYNVTSLGDFCFRNTKIDGVYLRGANYTICSNYDDEKVHGVDSAIKEFDHIGLNPFYGVKIRFAFYTNLLRTYTDYGDNYVDGDGNSDWKEYDLQYFKVINSSYYESYYSGVTDLSKNILYAYSSKYEQTLPNTITVLADYAISGSELSSIDLNAVTTIGDGFLYQCPNLKSITCDNSQFKAVNGVLYTADMQTLVKYPCASDANEYVIPSSVTQISKWAFEGASKLTTLKIETNTPPSLGEMVFEGIDVGQVTLYVPAGTKAAYEVANVWKDFKEIIEMEEQGISPDDIYLLKNVETGKYLFTGNEWGTHAVLADVGLPAQLSKQSDGSYTIFFPVGSGYQQMLFRHDQANVYVDYHEDGCPYWTLTNAGNGNYFIQTLTTHETYGQEAMPGTYLGNDPTKEAHNQEGTALDVYNDVDGNVTNAEGMNFTWTLEPVSAHSDAQVTLLQELISTAQGLVLDTDEEESLLNNPEATYLEMTESIVDLQKRIKEKEKNISDGNKKKEDLNKLIACANAVDVDTSDAQAVADNFSNLDEINEAINSLHETYITKLGEGVATTLLPLDVTGVILNPSFVIDDADGWTWNEEEDGPGFEFWNDAEYFQRTFDFHQQLTGLPNGSYLLKVKGFHRPGANGDVFCDYMQGTDNARAQLYANDESVTLVNQASCALEEQIDGWCGLEVSSDGTTRYVPNNMHDANMWFANGYYENVLPVTVTDGTLRVGIRLDESVETGWVIFDDFRLYYHGEIIEFSDENVKAICVENWDTNGDGELSMAEAAAVTDLGTVFKGNEEITSFEELQYFTGLTSIGAGAFDNCHSLISVTIPRTVTSLESCAFCGTWGLQSLVIPDGVTSIEELAVAWQFSLFSIAIPSSVTNIVSNAFASGCLTTVTVAWENPLAVPENTFKDTSIEYATLYVPAGTKAAYQAADVWKDFGNIVEYVDLVENGKMEENPSEDWTSFWVNEWRTMEEKFEGPANIVEDPKDTGNHCAKVVVRSQAEAMEAGNMSDDGEGNFADWDSQFFIQSKVKIESGKKLRLIMRVRADKATSIRTEAHQTPGDYNHWELFSDIDVTPNWKWVEREVVITPDMTQENNGKEMRTVAFDLARIPDGNVFYFDDIKLEILSPDDQIIFFADDAVKAICVENWDTNGDGKLSMEEAAAVTELGEVFKGNEEITSFDELQYFTGLTGIGDNAFNGCSGLSSITIPDNVTWIGLWAFAACSGLTSITIPNSVEYITYGAFSFCI